MEKKNLMLSTSGGRILQTPVKYINDGGGILLETSCESAPVSFFLRDLAMFSELFFKAQFIIQ